jgi:hypothetical protein
MRARRFYSVQKSAKQQTMRDIDAANRPAAFPQSSILR